MSDRTVTDHTTREHVPITWPGGFGLYQYSKRAVMRNWATILPIALLSFVTTSVSMYYGSLDRQPTLILTTLLELLTVFLGLAATFTYLQSARDAKVRLSEALNIAAQPMLFLKLLANSIVVAILMALSILALIVPFFFVLPRLYLTGYFVVDKNLGPIEAVRMSWDTTQGHAMKIWAIIAASIAMGMLFITVIGIPFAVYFLFMYGAASAVTYLFVTETYESSQSDKSVQPPEE